MANAIDDEYGIKEDNENDPKFGTYEYFEASHHNFHKKAELDAAGFIRTEENAKQAQTQELDMLCYLLYNVYIINIK